MTENILEDGHIATPLKPSEIVVELDRYIVGQADAKRAVAIAIRNRWRRQQLPREMQAEVSPKNIMMIKSKPPNTQRSDTTDVT